MSHIHSEIFPYGCIGSEDPDITLHVQLTGVGDEAVRMGKRLKCAATALGVGMDILWIKDSGAGPVAAIDGETLLDQLLSTEEVEARLRDWLAAHPQASG